MLQATTATRDVRGRKGRGGKRGRRGGRGERKGNEDDLSPFPHTAVCPPTTTQVLCGSSDAHLKSMYPSAGERGDGGGTGGGAQAEGGGRFVARKTGDKEGERRKGKESGEGR